MSLNAQVRTVRPHDTSEGLKQPGEVYDRTREDADTLAAIGVVEIVEAKPVAKPKRATKAK
jgi:hypothetical protein